MEQGVAFARNLQPDRSEPPEQESDLQGLPVLGLAVDPERCQQAASRELQAVVDALQRGDSESVRPGCRAPSPTLSVTAAPCSRMASSNRLL